MQLAERMSINPNHCRNWVKLSETECRNIRASSYEPGNRAGPSYRDEFCSVFRWEISAWSTGMNSRNTTKMVEHKFVLFATFKAFWTLVTLLIKLIRYFYIRSKLCHFVGLYLVRAKRFCLRSFVPVTGLECSYGKIFIPVTEISVTGPARPLI